MCVLSIIVPIRKKSGNLFNVLRTFFFRIVTRISNLTKRRKSPSVNITTEVALLSNNVLHSFSVFSSASASASASVLLLSLL